MSTTPEPQQGVTIVPPALRELRIYSHSALFYWWPVWATGLIMALLTIWDNHRMAIVPNHTEQIHKATVELPEEGGKKLAYTGRDVLILPEGKQLPTQSHFLFMHPSKNLGVLYATVLLVIIFITNVPLRGLWSVALVMLIVIMSLGFALAGWWDWILEKLRYLDIHINAGGYMFISLLLFAIWAGTFFIFDHRHYMIISSGQVRICMAVGAGETAYDTTSMTFQKRQDDLFRHWIVGLGSGDLIVTTSNRQEIDLPNVLFIATKIREIERMLKEREVV